MSFLHRIEKSIYSLERRAKNFDPDMTGVSPRITGRSSTSVWLRQYLLSQHENLGNLDYAFAEGLKGLGIPGKQDTRMLIIHQDSEKHGSLNR